MFKEYTAAGSQSVPIAQQNRTSVDLMAVTSYTRSPSNNYITMHCNGTNIQVFMTEAEFEEFKINIKTANRLKRGYE